MRRPETSIPGSELLEFYWQAQATRSGARRCRGTGRPLLLFTYKRAMQGIVMAGELDDISSPEG